MKTLEKIVVMQEDLRLAMMSMQASEAPPEVIERSAVALGSAYDTLSWVMERPSTLAELETEYANQREEVSRQN